MNSQRAILSNESNYTVFRVGDKVIRFRAPYSLEHYTEVKEYKSQVWIYGHDHKEEDIIINNTRFVSNPWGYDTKDFKIKTLTLTK